MKLKTLRRPGVRDLSSMFDKAGGVGTDHLTWADEAGLESLLDLLDHEHPKIRAMAEEFTSNLRKEKHDIGGFKPLSEMLKYKTWMLKNVLFGLSVLWLVTMKLHMKE